MIVEPDFPSHWKTQLLISLVAEAAHELANGNPPGTQSEPTSALGFRFTEPTFDPRRIQPEAAPMWVIRLWAHCHQRKTGTFPGMTTHTLRAVCSAPLPPDRWRDILLECQFLDPSASAIIVHGWEEANAKMVANWRNGVNGGRKKAGEKNPRETQVEPKSNPEGTKREERREREDRVPPVVPLPGDLRQSSSLASASPHPQKKERGGVPGDRLVVVDDAVRRLCGIFGRKAERVSEEARRALWSWADGGLLPMPEADWQALERYYTPLPTPGTKDELARRHTVEKLAENLAGEVDAARRLSACASTEKKERPEPEGWREWLAETYPDGRVPATWAELPASVRAEFENQKQKNHQP